MDHLKAERGLSSNTVAAYRRDLRHYVDYLRECGVARPDQIDPGVVAGFAHQMTAEGLSSATVARMTVAVRGLHRFWVSEHYASEDPASQIQPPHPGLRLPKALTVDQVDRLIAATGGMGPVAAPEQLRDWALVELLYGTGARVSEALGLNVDDATRLLTEPTAGLRLQGKGHSERVVPVGSYARASLEAWLVRGRPTLAKLAKVASPALFLNARGGRLSRQSCFNRIAELGRLAKIGADVSPHTLRHSYATHLIDAGADVRVVQELLGHVSVATTQVYTLITVDHLREVYRQAHPRAL
jgi:integrase/recombinase XerD